MYWLVVQRTYEDCGKLSRAVRAPAVVSGACEVGTWLDDEDDEDFDDEDDDEYDYDDEEDDE